MPQRALLFASWVPILACTGAPAREIECSDKGAGTTQAALNGGVPDANYIGLGEAELDAVVEIAALDAAGLTLSTCTGTLIAPTWILSAAHCDMPSRSRFEVRRVDGEGTVRSVVAGGFTQRWDQLDLMLMQVETEAFVGVSPIRIARTMPSDIIGQRVQLGGTGYAEGASPSSRLFAVVIVVRLTDTHLIVGANGYAGACSGDSGGPLLIRGADGRPEVLGVLSEGSVTCWAEDKYVRTDSSGSFLSFVGDVQQEASGCGQLAYEGRCFGDVSVWCDGVSLLAEPCLGGLRCGFDEPVGGFRCVEPAADPCRGVDELGECRSGDALTCSSGRVLRNACSECGADCVISPRTGRATCVESD